MSENDYWYPEVSQEIATAYRTAHRALEKIIPGEGYGFIPEKDLSDAIEVLSQFPAIVEMAQNVVNAYLGPRIAWTATSTDGKFELTVAGIDLDDPGGSGDFAVKLAASAYEGDSGTWSDSSLDLAASVYRSEAGWDFAPGEAGTWLLMLAPESVVGASGEWSYCGRLAGFVILYDRDDDGKCDSVGHMWTAHAWRRRGIARQLLQEAKSRFGYERVEGPLTGGSAALLKAFPDLSGMSSGNGR